MLRLKRGLVYIKKVFPLILPKAGPKKVATCYIILETGNILPVKMDLDDDVYVV